MSKKDPASGKPKKSGADKARVPDVATNKKARHKYVIEETLEAGLVLSGTEVKALRARQVNIADAFCIIKDGEVWMYKANIGEYEMGNRFNHEPYRRRKVLLHKREIRRLLGKLIEKGMTIVPLRLYFNDRGFAKAELALVRGKRQYDKRQVLKKRDADREIARRMKDSRR